MAEGHKHKPYCNPGVSSQENVHWTRTHKCNDLKDIRHKLTKNMNIYIYIYMEPVFGAAERIGYAVVRGRELIVHLNHSEIKLNAKCKTQQACIVSIRCRD